MYYKIPTFLDTKIIAVVTFEFWQIGLSDSGEKNVQVYLIITLSLGSIEIDRVKSETVI